MHTRQPLTVACQHCGDLHKNADEQTLRFTCGICLLSGKPRQPMQLQLDGSAEERGSELPVA